jgi:hypothetical protein
MSMTMRLKATPVPAMGRINWALRLNDSAVGSDIAPDGVDVVFVAVLVEGVAAAVTHDAVAAFAAEGETESHVDNSSRCCSFVNRVMSC